MGPVSSLLDGLLSAFGPFLIPVVLFVGGVAFYILLWWFGKASLDPDSDSDSK
jgi:hypothetical protein